MADPQTSQQKKPPLDVLGEGASNKEAGEEKTVPESREAVAKEAKLEGTTVTFDVREQRTEEVIEQKAEGKEKTKEIEKKLANEQTIIETIEPEKGITEQKEAIEKYFAPATESLLIKLIGAGKTIDKLEDLLPVLKKTTLLTKARLRSAEIASIKKWEEINNLPKNNFYQEWKNLWDTTLNSAKNNHGAAQEVLGGKGPWYERAISYAKENPGKTVACVAAGALGIWSVWKLAKSFFGKGDVPTGAVATIGIGGALLAVGTLLDPSKWMGWVKEKLSLNLSWKNLWEFFETGNLDVLTDAITVTDDLSKKVADHLGVEASAVAALKKEPLEKFMSNSSSLLTLAADSALTAAKELGVENPIPETVYKPANTKAAKALLTEFNTKEASDLIKKEKPKTVGEALELLDKNKFFEGVAAGAAAAVAGPTQTPTKAPAQTKTPSKDDDIFGEGEDQIGISAESWKELEQALQDKSNTRKVLHDKFESIGSWINPFDMWALCGAVKDDGMALVKSEKKGLMLWTGAKFILLSPLAAVGNTFMSAIEAYGDDEKDAGDVAQTYIDNSLGLMILFGASKIIQGLFDVVKGDFKGAALNIGKGVVRGGLAPLTMLRWEVKTAVLAGDSAAGLGRAGQERIFRNQILLKRGGSPEMVEARNAIRMQQLKFYADTFKKFDALYQASKHDKGILSAREGISTATHLKRKIIGGLRLDHVVKLREKYARKFAVMYDKMLITDKNFPGNFKGLAIGEENANPISGEFKAALCAFDEFHETTIKAQEETKIKSRADEIKKAREVGRGWGKFDKASIRQMLIERGLDPDAQEAVKYMENWDRAMARQEIQGQRFNPYEPVEVEGVKLRPRLERLKSTEKGTFYRYQGVDFEIPAQEVSRFPGAGTGATQSLAHYEAARAYCEKRWRIPAAKALDVEFSRVLDDGTRKFKINGEAFVGADLDAAKIRYLQALEEKHTVLPKDFVQRMRYHMSWAPAAELILGTPGVAFLVYELETATDKQAVVTKALSVIGTGMAGAKAFEMSLGKFSTNPYYHLFGTLAASIIGVMGLEKQTETILNAVAEQVPGIKEASKDIGRLIESRTIRAWVVKPLLTQAPELAGKAGFKKLETFLLKKMESRVVVGIERIAAKTWIKTILRSMGWKGAATGILLADDATVIGVVDDIVALGFLVWSASDIVSISKTILNARTIKNELEQRKGTPIQRLQLESQSRDKLVSELKTMGYEESQIYVNGEINPQIIEQIPEDRLFAILDNSKFTVERARIAGKEEWELSGGEVASLTIYDDSGKIASMTNEEIEKSEEAMKEYDTKMAESTPKAKTPKNQSVSEVASEMRRAA